MAMITKRPRLNAEANAMLVGRFSSSVMYPAPIHPTLNLSLVGDENMLQN